MFDWIADPNAWIALATLTALEIVLGIDNIIFISILVGRLPEARRNLARRLGLGLAMVSRILLLPQSERVITDMAPYALEALATSRVREVSMLGRRGAAQAAFTNVEIKELGHRIDGDVVVASEDVELDEMSHAEVEAGGRMAKEKIDVLRHKVEVAEAGLVANFLAETEREQNLALWKPSRCRARPGCAPRPRRRA